MKHLIALLFLSSVMAMAPAYATGGRAGASSGTDVSPDHEPTCGELVRNYLDISTDPTMLVPPDLQATVREVATGSEPCRARLARIIELFEAFWATDPWCRHDRDALSNWLTTSEGMRIPQAANGVVSDLLASTTLTCYESVAAVVTTLRHYDPQPFTDGTAPSLLTVGAVGMGVESDLAMRTAGAIRKQIRKSSKGRKSCQRRSRR